MTFDPFGDFEERGYLRNHFCEKDYDIIKHLEHSSFVSSISEAFNYLSGLTRLSYQDVLETHKILFRDIYPWAGQDRTLTASEIAIGKGDVLFAHPKDIRRSVEYALKYGQQESFMKERPGYIMGYLAYGHPFLDGNGRTVMIIHTELAERAGISINWSATSKDDYLSALTKEIDDPNKGTLDLYLSQFVAASLGRESLISHVNTIQGLRGNEYDINTKQTIIGDINNPKIRERYIILQKQRKNYLTLGKP